MIKLVAILCLASAALADTYTVYAGPGAIVHVYVPRRAGFDPDCNLDWDQTVNPNVPALNSADFTCFLQKFAAHELYAECDGQPTQPVFNSADFTCFLQSFARRGSAPVVFTEGTLTHERWRWEDYWEYEIKPVGGRVSFVWYFPCIVGKVETVDECHCGWEQLTTLGFPGSGPGGVTP